MKILIAVLMLWGFSACAIADNGQDDIKALARKSIQGAAKNFCVGEWSDNPHSISLAPYASVSEMCQCVEREISYTASNELAERFVTMQFYINATNSEKNSEKYLSKEVNNKTLQDFLALYGSAVRGCGEKFIRQRR